MSVRVRLDGAAHSGGYQAVCECGSQWTGVAEREVGFGFSPAMPVAETVVHMALGHGGAQVDLVFTERFVVWLEAYWKAVTTRHHRNQDIEQARRPLRRYS